MVKVKEVKKKPPKKKTVAKKKPPVNADGVLCLTREHLLELELMHSKLLETKGRVQNRVLEAEKLEREALLQSRALRADAQQFQQEFYQLEDDKKRLNNRLSEHYGVDFKQVSYNSDTGVLNVQEDNPLATQEGRQKKRRENEKK